ncbi:hypothetical protein EVAR_93427_1 [Eumeta japonica]|uniref:Uncharacterized protein n=1 Tax=Eumeta variegata TaxID=151549 RepID=A0A4C1UQI4_EUMVA|nr:hypothetical protein EVAR_93427_1 [Eumeta japonica]
MFFYKDATDYLAVEERILLRACSGQFHRIWEGGGGVRQIPIPENRDEVRHPSRLTPSSPKDRNEDCRSPFCLAELSRNLTMPRSTMTTSALDIESSRSTTCNLAHLVCMETSLSLRCSHTLSANKSTLSPLVAPATFKTHTACDRLFKFDGFDDMSMFINSADRFYLTEHAQITRKVDLCETICHVNGRRPEARAGGSATAKYHAGMWEILL